MTMQVSKRLSVEATETSAPVFPRTHIAAFVLVTALFFIWGMSNNLTDILVQQFKKSFELSWIQAQLVQTAVFLGYFTMAIPAAMLMRRWGYKAGMLTGLALFGAGTLLFWPAAIVGQYAPFLAALFMVGCGSAILETAANPFIAQFGDASTSEKRLNAAQAFNPLGTLTGVMIGGTFIFSGVELSGPQVIAMKDAGTYAAYLHTEIMRVVPTYVGLAALVAVLAIVLWKTPFPSIRSEDEGENAAAGGFAELLKFPGLMMAVVAQFFYVGAQVATWSNLIPYMKQYTTITEKGAAHYLMATLIALAVGRIVSTSLMRYVQPAKMMTLYAAVNMVLLAFSVMHPGMGGTWAIVATSFFMSIMFPTIFALGVKGLGPYTKLGGSIIVMSIVGGALFPPLVGVVAKHTGSLALGYLLPLVAYGVVAVYGLVGGRVAVEEEQAAPMVL
jgi:FHS family L-fucose permease-like MFS transporter